MKLARKSGKKHTFLGMDIEFIGDGNVAITTKQHASESIEDFYEEIKWNVVNPTNSKLL